MRPRLMAVAAAVTIVVSACSGSTEPSPSVEADAGAVLQRAPDPTAPAYSPAGRSALLYSLPSAVSGIPLIESPVAAIRADEADLATDPLIRRALVDLGLAPSVINIVQRGNNQVDVPDVSVTAVQFKGLPGEDFANFVPSVYLLATSVTTDQHNMTGAKPPRRQLEIDGRTVEAADWGEFDVVWYAHGDVVFIVLASNPQLLEAALRTLPPLG